MTEIPEHLLKRSRERRQALGLPTEGGDAPAAAAAPAPAAAATPATTGSTPATAPAGGAPPRAPGGRATPAAPPPPKPDPPYVAAAKARRRIPFWAMPVLALLPVWAFMYSEAMKPPVVKATGPLAQGATLFANCASCHGSAGEGGVGYELNNGEVLKSFPKIEDQIAFVYTGNKPYIGKPYGSGRHIGGQKGASGAMPAWGTTAGGSLTDVELVDVVCHERITIGGEDPTSPEAVAWCTADGAQYQKVVSGGIAAVGIKPLT